MTVHDNMQNKVESIENLERYLFQDGSGLSNSGQYAKHVCKTGPLLGIDTLRIIGSPERSALAEYRDYYMHAPHSR